MNRQRWRGILPATASACLVIGLGASLASAASAGDELGRLFFSPERRQQLDYQRQFNIQERRKVPEEMALTIDGVVTRSSGRHTVWVNGVATERRDDGADGDVVPMRKNPQRVIVRSGESPPVDAKVGDTVHRDTGETTDALQGGRIVIRRQNPAR